MTYKYNKSCVQINKVDYAIVVVRMSIKEANMSTIHRINSHPLYKFLQKYECQVGCKPQDIGICGMGDVKGKWNIPDSAYSEYLDLLHNYLFVEKGRPINLVEQPRLDKPKPLLIDLDFKFPVDTTLQHRFEKQNVRKFINKVTEGLNHFFDTEQYESLRFFVSYRPQAYPDGKKYVKDGIHIQSPDICLVNDKQRVLRSWLLDQKAVEESFEEIGYTNTVEDIYDESMVRKQGWFFYGESKPNVPSYKLNTIVAYNPQLDSLDEEDPKQYTERELMELLSVRYNVLEDDNEVHENSKELYDKYLKAKIPTLQPAVASTQASSSSSNMVLRESIGVHIPEMYDEEEIGLVRRLATECLSVTRADNYLTWMQVGWCLYNIEATEEMFDTWVEFSKKSAKSDGTDWGDLKRKWFRGFSKNTEGAKLTIKSLHYWARDDDLDTYNKLVEEDYVRYVQYRVDDTHFHLAKLLQRMYKGRFCASVEVRGTDWYVYDEKINSWRRTNQGIELREKLSTEVADLIVRARLRLKKKAWDEYSQNNVNNESGPDDDWYKKWAMTVDGERFQMLVKVEKNLYKSEYKNSVMKEAVEMFYEEDFGNKMDINPYLFACKNGTLDLRCFVVDQNTKKEKIKVVFRPGKPDDNIRFLAGRSGPDTEPIDYVPYDASDPKQIELMEFLSKIFVTKDFLNYYIRLMSSCLEGSNKEQCYYTFIGVGGNGKSKVNDLMKYTLGDYSASLQATALTRKRPDSSAANPDIIGIKNKRYIYLQEPDEREPLNTSRMKQFSGEDYVEARGLFKEQDQFRITGKLFMMCNRFPPINAMDRGTWRRIRVLKFGSKFVDPSDPELKQGKANVFLRDNELDAKIRSWREAWLGLLVHVYEKEYIVNGLEPIPDCVMDESNKYKESFDQYGKFKAERMIDFRDPRLGLEETGVEQTTLKEVLTAYTYWLKQNEGTLVGKRLNKQELQNRLEEDFGNLDNGIFKRCIVFYDEETKEEYEKEHKV
jgi:P4 family phage/plasmid primase-like protien